MRRPRRIINPEPEKRTPKNFLPTIFLIIILWSIISYMIFYVSPDSIGAVPIFFVLVFVVILLSAATILASSRRGFLLAVGITFFGILRYLGVGNIVNLALIVGICITLEIYLGTKRLT